LVCGGFLKNLKYDLERLGLPPFRLGRGIKGDGIGLNSKVLGLKNNNQIIKAIQGLRGLTITMQLKG